MDMFEFIRNQRKRNAQKKKPALYDDQGREYFTIVFDDLKPIEFSAEESSEATAQFTLISNSESTSEENGFNKLTKELIVAESLFEKNNIKKPPFWFLMQISSFLPNKYGQIVEQNVSDLRIEYYEALAEKNIWKARCIVGFYYTGLSWTVVQWIVGRLKDLIGVLPKLN